MSSDAEEWRGIRGWEDRYEISTLGRVRSLLVATRAGMKRRAVPLIRKIRIKGVGAEICLSRDNDAHTETIGVGRAVMMHFGHPPPHLTDVIGHKNEDKADNTIGNLEWRTRPEWGECLSVLTEESVAKARIMAAGGARTADIARAFGVNVVTMRKAIAGVTWPHLDTPPHNPGKGNGAL